MLSVNGTDSTIIGSNSKVNLQGFTDDYENKLNVKITRDNENNITFDLAEHIQVGRVTTGLSSMSNAGFMITGGPRMTKGGIHGDFKTITGVGDGVLEKDAVNLSQLKGVKKELENLIADSMGDNGVSNNIVEYHEASTAGESYISIGAKKDGVIINIANEDKQSRKISGVANGMLSANSTEAVNGSQLFEVDTKVNVLSTEVTELSDYFDEVQQGALNIAKHISLYLGGGANVLEGIAPNYNIQGRIYDNVETAFNAVDTSLTGIYDLVSNVIENDLVQQKDNDSPITIGKATNGLEINIANSKEQERKLSGVMSGEISLTSTEAINGSQLYSMGTQLAAYLGGGAKYENGQWIAPSFMISQFNSDGSVSKQQYQSVADAFGGVNDSMKNINDRINEATDKFDSDVVHWNHDKGAYDVSYNGQAGKITNVAKGEVTQDSTDAVNGAQLWETNNRIDGVEKDVQHLENRVDNISNTIADIGGLVTDIENKFDDFADGVVSYDKNEDGEKTNKITLAGGDESEPVLIDNLADGNIKKGSKEAVNGGQLHDYTEQQMKIALEDAKKYTDQRVNNIVVDAIDDAVEKSKQYTDMRFDVLNYGIENARKEARQAAAIGLAVSNLRYNDTPGKLSIAFGTGIWRSQSAFAFGAGYTSENGDIKSNLSLTSSGGHWGIGAGFNFTLN